MEGGRQGGAVLVSVGAVVLDHFSVFVFWGAFIAVWMVCTCRVTVYVDRGALSVWSSACVNFFLDPFYR